MRILLVQLLVKDFQKNQQEPLVFYKAIKEEFPSQAEFESDPNVSEKAGNAPSITLLTMALMSKANSDDSTSQLNQNEKIQEAKR